MNKTFDRWSRRGCSAAALVLGRRRVRRRRRATPTPSGTTDAPAATEAPAGTEAPAASGEAPASGEGITLAVNPWTGSAVNANVAKVVLESKLGTPVELVDDRRERHVGRHGGRLDRRRARGVAVGSRRRLRDLHHREPDASSTSACSARRPRSAGTCRRSSSTSTPSWPPGRASRIPSWPSCSPPPSRATSASS